MKTTDEDFSELLRILPIQKSQIKWIYILEFANAKHNQSQTSKN